MALPIRAQRAPLVLIALLVLAAGMWGGLLRLGWPWRPVAMLSVPYHGPLMIGGFFGTLIGLERAVALGRRWTYLAPIASALSAVALLFGMPVAIGQWLLVIASAMVLVVFGTILRKQSETFTWTMASGAVAWFVGNLIWATGHLIPTAVPWWIAFLVLTIVGERLELSRFLPHTRTRQVTFLLATATYAVGLIAGWWLPGLGLAISGVGLVAMADWLWKYDLARTTVRMRGLTRFVAACLLSGYVWLAAGGVLSIFYALLPALHDAHVSWMTVAPTAGLQYDAILHSVLLGFVIAMIFGHAPIIFPAVLSVRMEYRPWFYSHLLFLQASVLLRIMSDVIDSPAGRQWAGLLNVLAVTLFLVNTIMNVRFRELPPSAAPAPAAAAPIRLSTNLRKRGEATPR